MWMSVGEDHTEAIRPTREIWVHNGNLGRPGLYPALANSASEFELFARRVTLQTSNAS